MFPILILLLTSTTFVSPAAAAVETNRMVEISIESAASSPDPFRDVDVDAVFTDPTGLQRRVPGFWSGGRTWRFRYASPVAGTHRYRTECSDSTNRGLHGVRGEVRVTPYSGQNPLYRHGSIRVAEDQRHFAHTDGTPFFWLGDTWWMGLAKRLRWPEDFQQLAADRKDKGFTVIQIVAGLYPDMPAFDERGLGDGGLPWEKSYARIRPEYFDAADRRILHLVDQGLVPCILGAWGYHLPWLGQENMKRHWRYIIARWGALPVVWAAAGEQAMPWYLSGNKEAETEQLRREWTSVIRYIRQSDPFQRLLTTHPRRNARDEVIDPELLDFEMQQTGHGHSADKHAASAWEAWQRGSKVPVISGESRYEALEVKPKLNAREAREAFWAHLLNSGVSGHTYGANGVWQVNLPDQRFGKSPGGHDWGGTPWREAMQLPGSTQLSHAKRFLLTLPWYEFEADPAAAEGAMSAAVTRNRKVLLAFTLQKALRISTQRIIGQWTARWFDPVSGKTQPAEGVSADGARLFSPPAKNAAGEEDWVLLVEGR
ncbi:MAG: DUF4038 domain-containing protein [Acidimicrobiia bacterium]|nr:DUF4038 domain-containing protein [Acidimicrobiia bacterium]